MYPMWEVHQVITEHHNTLRRHTRRESLLRQFKAAPSQDSDAWTAAILQSERDELCRLQAAQGQDGRRQAARNRWRWLAGLLGHWYRRPPEAAQR
jgi:hypothetical protein